MKVAKDIAALLGTVEGVPHVNPPVVWDMRLTTAANVNTIENYFRQYERYLPAGCWFDEAAIMVHSEEGRSSLVTRLEESGWQEVNHAADLVYTSPMSTRYVVEYTFLVHPGKPWRLEIMLLGKGAKDLHPGFSPLHQALWYPNGDTPVWAECSEFPMPHLSFKPPVSTVAEVGSARAVRLAMAHLQDKGFILTQACQSTYGHFWYLIHNDAMRQIYVKPRVNLRDV